MNAVMQRLNALMGPHAAVMGIKFYTGKMFPAEYQGSFFFADYLNGFMRRVDASGNAHDFGTNVAGPLGRLAELEAEGCSVADAGEMRQAHIARGGVEKARELIASSIASATTEPMGDSPVTVVSSEMSDVIVPTTWFDVGAGVHGDLGRGFRASLEGEHAARFGERWSDVSIVVEWRVAAMKASRMLIKMNKVARIAVARVRKSAAPRADIRPEGLPPVVKPPPSERCMRITVTSSAAMIAWTTSRKVNIETRPVAKAAT